MKVYVVYDRDMDDFWVARNNRTVWDSLSGAKCSIAYNKKWGGRVPENYIILEYNLGELMIESKDVYHSGEDE